MKEDRRRRRGGEEEVEDGWMKEDRMGERRGRRRWGVDATGKMEGGRGGGCNG